MDFIISGIAAFFDWLGLIQDSRALPAALQFECGPEADDRCHDYYGPDSFIGRLLVQCRVLQTTFHIIAVYFGSVGIKTQDISGMQPLLILWDYYSHLIVYLFFDRITLLIVHPVNFRLLKVKVNLLLIR